MCGVLVVPLNFLLPFSLPQVYDGDIETMFQVLFTDSEFMREFLHSRGTTSKHINNTNSTTTTTTTAILQKMS